MSAFETMDHVEGIDYAATFGREREPMKGRARHPEYRRRGAPARVSGIHCRRQKRWTWGSGRGARVLNLRAFASCVAFAVATLAANAFGITITYENIGNPGNAARPVTTTSGSVPGVRNIGAVSSLFKMSKYETTNEQYAEFLNTVDPTGSNPNSIWTTSMQTDANGGISRDLAAANGSKYATKSGMAPKPVLFTTWWSAARFANWMNNGATSGSSTETGAYTLSNRTSGAIVARNPGALVFLPSADEWYKAAFNTGLSSSSYVDWATNNNTQPLNTVTNLTNANAANFGDTATPTTGPLDRGSYVNAVSPYSVFDMLGNVTEWTDTAGTTGADSGRGQVFSGSWNSTLTQATDQWKGTPAAWTYRSSTNSTSQIGFRVAAVPEPETIALAGAGIASLAGLDWLKRRRRRVALTAALQA